MSALGMSRTISKVCVGAAVVTAMYCGGQSVMGGAISTSALMAVTVQNRINSGSETRTKLKKVDRWAHYIGSGDVAGLVPSFSNWAVSGATNTLVDNNEMTIVSASVEYLGIVVPVTFSGGASRVLAAGENDVQADEIPPSAFGIEAFPLDAEVWTKSDILLASTADKIPFSVRNVGDTTGQATWWYDPAVTTVSSTSTPGTFAYTGTAPTIVANGYVPMMLGKFVGGAQRVDAVHGDSISAGTGDSTAYKYGRGYFQRAMAVANSGAPRASINFAVHGSAATSAYVSDKLAAFYKYATNGLIFYGTNDFGSTATAVTVAAMNTRVSTIASRMKTFADAKITRVGACSLLMRATSTDLWVTEENQTLMSAGWGAGGYPEQFNAGLASVSGIDFVIPFASVRGVDPYKWKVNGVARYLAYDDTHPSTGGANVMMAEALPFLA